MKTKFSEKYCEIISKKVLCVKEKLHIVLWKEINLQQKEVAAAESLLHQKDYIYLQSVSVFHT